MRRTIDSLVSSDVQDRARVHQFITSDVGKAFEIASAMGHPWYRCQALAAVGDVLPEAKARVALDRALRAAHELTEPNRIVTVASWPVGVWVRRGLGDISGEIEKLLAIIATEPHSLRRADALSWLIGSVAPDDKLRERVLSAFLASLHASHGWRAERLWANLVLLMREHDASAAQNVLHAMPEGRAKRRLSRATPPPASQSAPA
jgi:hypothetical protein